MPGGGGGRPSGVDHTLLACLTTTPASRTRVSKADQRAHGASTIACAAAFVIGGSVFSTITSLRFASEEKTWYLL